MVTVPQITGRYYTVQFLNGWGETVANINERVFPQHPSGQFAVCLAGSHLAMNVHHTDADREWAYDRGSHIGKLERGLDEAATRGWILADMKRDWKTIYPPK